MFDDFYGLTGRPFQLTPDPNFYFESGTHRKALSYLGYGLAQGEGFIVIDDLVDTGGTAVAIREMYPKAHFVTIFAKPAGRPLVNDYVVDIPQDTWIEQPWDMGVVFVPPISGR